MRVDLLRIDELDQLQLARWRELQDRCAETANAFVGPEFAQAAHRSGQAIEVALVYEESSGQLVGVLPFHRNSAREAVPVGWPSADFNALLSAPNVELRPAEILSGVGLQRWHFDHLADPDEHCQPFVVSWDPSPYIDLEGGFERFCHLKQEEGSNLIKQARAKLRRLDRALGEVKLEWNHCSPELLERLIAWKRVQIERRLFDDIFKRDYIRRLIHETTNVASDQFSTVLSLLRAGEDVVAMHFALVRKNCMTTWMPTHNPEFEKLSPGLVLMYLLVQECESHGVSRIELGRGMNQLKTRFMTGTHPVGIGTIDRSVVRRWARKGKQKLRDAVLAAPFSAYSRHLYRRYKRVLGAFAKGDNGATGIM